MKNIVVATLIGMSILGSVAVSANAGTAGVHGYGTQYGR